LTPTVFVAALLPPPPPSTPFPYTTLFRSHESHDVARFVRDPGDAAQRAVRVQALIAEDHPVARFEFVEHLFGGDVAALTVLQRDADRLSPLIVPGPRGGRVLDNEL